MKENKKTRKELVKTAAIVFLSVMLVLTLFSNTIMNYSLPEVATQYIQPGSITSQIRGTGIVESGDPYNVKVSGTRKVESIQVSVGQQVEKGEILMFLSYEDSEALKAARAELEAAQLAFETTLLTGDIATSVMQSAGVNVSADTYKNQIITLKNAVDHAENEVKTAQKNVDDLNQWSLALSTQISITPSNNADTTKEKKAMEDAKLKMEEAEADLQKARNVLDEVLRNISIQESVSSGDAAAMEPLKEQELNAKRAVNDATTVYADAQLTYNNAQAAFNNKVASGDTAGTIESLKNQLNQAQLNLFHAENALSEKQKVLEEKQDILNDYIKNTTDSMDLSSKYQVIADAREKVNKMEAEMNSSEVIAPISGTITSINVQSGLDTPEDGIVMLMQPEGTGHTLSFSVTNEQARKVSVGEKASLINSWRYDDLEVILTRIMPDKADPGQKKLLVFEVSGDSVIAGQNLNVAVGQKSQNYDMLVPNSAIREDNNGKFILIIEAKNSPLGNRYIATRVDVEVIASDDTQSAITGGVYGYEYVITTSTKPVVAGQQVRMPD